MSTDEILRLLDEVTARLEGPALEVFSLGVRATLTTSAVTVIAGVVMVVAGLYVIRWAFQWYEAGEPKDRFGSNFRDVPGMFIVIGAGCAVIAGFLLIWHSLPRLLNPEWYTLTDIIGRTMP